MKSPFDVVQTVLVTEKMTELNDVDKYGFKVHPSANKIEIKNAVEKLFDVKVKSVNVMNYSGKKKRAGRTMRFGRRSNWKKAIVTLSEGSIDVM